MAITYRGEKFAGYNKPKASAKGRPTANAFKQAAKTAKPKKTKKK